MIYYGENLDNLAKILNLSGLRSEPGQIGRDLTFPGLINFLSKGKIIFSIYHHKYLNNTQVDVPKTKVIRRLKFRPKLPKLGQLWSKFQLICRFKCILSKL